MPHYRTLKAAVGDLAFRFLFEPILSENVPDRIRRLVHMVEAVPLMGALLGVAQLECLIGQRMLVQKQEVELAVRYLVMDDEQVDIVVGVDIRQPEENWRRHFLICYMRWMNLVSYFSLPFAFVDQQHTDHAVAGGSS